MTAGTAKLDCTLVKQLVGEWARERSGPFPFARIGEHLTVCLDCLAWATEVAHRPAEHYLQNLQLKLSDLLRLVGESLLRAWSQSQDVRVHFVVEPRAVPEAQRKTLAFLGRYETFSDQTRVEAERIRSIMAAAEPSTLALQLEPYELTRYFLDTALQMLGPAAGRLLLLVYLAQTEVYQAAAERRSGHEDRAARHFGLAQGYYDRVRAEDAAAYREMPAPRGVTRAGELTKADDRDALVGARINLAVMLVQQDRYSEASLHQAIALLFEARRLIADLALPETEFLPVHDNLMIYYLRLFLDHSREQGGVQARQLAEEICTTPELGPAFVGNYVVRQRDSVLTRLLLDPRAATVADYLHQQALTQER
jgi:hypothetical protein